MGQLVTAEKYVERYYDTYWDLLGKVQLDGILLDKELEFSKR